jgi:hydrogenase maturation protein HypF
MLKTYKILISGLVQGVGFRPHVYSIALQYSIVGTVSNNELGVIIIASGLEKNSTNFYNALLQSPPPVSVIQEASMVEIPYQHFTKFSIIPSKKNAALNLPLTPDFAICDDCKTDIKNANNHRFNYAFTTCVNCGPRYAITQTFPFERSNTSVHKFPMCDVCKKEYTNPADRRFHSQTNTCPSCGMQLKLFSNDGTEIKIPNHSLFKKIATLLENGSTIAVKNTSGYLLCCSAENDHVIQQLRRHKNRPNKPFAVLFPSLEYLQKEFLLTNKQYKSLTSVACPITIISLQNYKGALAINSIAPKLNQLGVMLPYTGILQLLANTLNFPVVATSGNIHGSPIISNNDEAIEKLKGVADYFLQHNLTIEQPQDDSVVKFSTKFNKKVVFRRSRGLAPNFLNITINSTEKILALGADLKSSIAFYPNKYIYLSQYIGNLENFDVYNRFIATTTAYLNIFEQQPTVVLVDKHPNYYSSIYGRELALKNQATLVEVQHHKAHFSAILGEHQLFNKKVLGVIFDGTGYGDDAAIWGGEFFKYENHIIERINHVNYFNWILGDKMAKEPRISLLALAAENMNELLAKKFTSNELKTYNTLKKSASLKTSSVGRLFDAVASLLDITDVNSYEGEAAILLENNIKKYDLKSCKSYLHTFNKGISATKIIQNIAIDVNNGNTVENIITNFIFTLATVIIKTATTNNYKHVALSGGVFQNTTLVDMLLELAPKEIKLYFHKNVSPNDENSSFGQLMYYLNIKN